MASPSVLALSRSTRLHANGNACGKEVIGGYAMLKAESMEHAIELTLQIHGDERELDCEVRQLEEAGCG